MQTDFAALDALYPLPPEELFRQWVLTRDAAAAPGGWARRSLHGWHLCAHGDAHVCDLRANDGTHIGWVVEPLAYLSATGDVIPETEVRLALKPVASAAEIERALYGRDERGRSSGDGLAGMWIAIVFAGPDNNRFRRVYLGPIHSVVFSDQHQTVATSHNLIPGLPRDQALSRAFDPLRTNAYFTFGLTAFRGLRRLLPNHYLDLDTFQAVRHWPAGRLEPLEHGTDGAAAIVEHSRRLLQLIAARHGAFHVFLSAGRDSRAILAMLRTLRDRAAISLSTTLAPTIPSLTDLQAARRLARIADLPHTITFRRRHSADARDVMRAFVRIGESKSGPILSSPDLRRPRPQRPGFNLAGMAGEVGRAYFWSGKRHALQELTPSVIADNVGAPLIEPVVAAAAQWYESLPPDLRNSAPDLLDLTYIEQRMGCWESSTRYLFPGRPRVLSPMAATFNLETMLRLPLDYRDARSLQRDMVACGWPQLLTVPFNQPTGLLHLIREAPRAPRHLRSKLGALRRRLGLRRGATASPSLSPSQGRSGAGPV